MFADLNTCATDDVQVQREQLALAARLGAGAQVTCVAGAADSHASCRVGYSQVATVRLVDAAALDNSHVRARRLRPAR